MKPKTRTCMLRVRFTPDEKELLEDLASKAGVPMSELIRQRTLARETDRLYFDLSQAQKNELAAVVNHLKIPANQVPGVALQLLYEVLTDPKKARETWFPER